MNDLNTLLGAGLTLWLLLIAIFVVVQIILLKIVTTIVTNTVLDVIERRKGRNWWQK